MPPPRRQHYPSQRFQPEEDREGRWLRQRSEQYFTSDQQLAHFLRQVKGLWQVRQILLGKSDFFRWRAMVQCKTKADSVVSLTILPWC